MNRNLNRRGLFRAFLTAVCGSGAAAVSVAGSSPPPRCRHYYDGVLWCSGHVDKLGWYTRDTAGCPYCHAEQEKGRRPLDPCHGTYVMYSSYLGGSGSDTASAIGADIVGHAFRRPAAGDFPEFPFRSWQASR